MNNDVSDSERRCEAADFHDQRNQHFDRLIAQARSGDILAFEALYSGTVRWLLARIRFMVDDGQAEDILAEVYLQVWRSLPAYDASRGPAALWLTMITRSRVYDHLRREQRISRRAVAQAIDTEPTHIDGPEQILTREQDARLLRVSMSSLTCDERLVLGLAYFRDSTQQEIATQTGIPLVRVKVLLGRAQRKLRLQFSGSSHAASTSASAAAQ